MKVTLEISGIPEKEFDDVVDNIIVTIKAYHDVEIYVGMGEPEDGEE